MRSLSLHIKTTIFASVIILLLLTATLAAFTARVLENIRQDQESLARLQAESLADHINALPFPKDFQSVARSIALVQEARPKAVVVRIWVFDGTGFTERISSIKTPAGNDLSEAATFALTRGRSIQFNQSDENNAPIYRIFVPLMEGNQVSGAVEITENLETSWGILGRFFWGEFWLVIFSVTILSLLIYALFRFYVYRPLDKLSEAIQRAQNGELTARAEIKSDDEIGAIATQFNRMLAQIAEFSNEREKQKDVLQLKVGEATAELQEKNAQLSEANREIWHTSRKMSEMERLAAAGQTAAQFAHEVGTPLNLISGHVQLLRAKSADNEPEAKRLDTISAQIERIEKIVRGMLDRTRVESVELVPTDLTQVLRKVFETIFPTVDKRKILLIEDLQEKLPVINGNADRLQQIFLNLINNALDAMPNGGELRITTKFESENVIVSISDTGNGMSEETKAHIFEPLFTTKQRGHGTGLGLVVVRELMSEHGGEIRVESKIGKGTEFILSFPYKSEPPAVAGGFK